MKFFLHCLLSLGLLTLMVSAGAENDITTSMSGLEDENLQGSDWQSRIGAQALYVPKFSGASGYEWTPFPLIDVQWKETVFLNSMRGIGLQFKPMDRLQLGTMLNYNWGRDDDADHHLNDLGDVAGSFEGGVFAAYQVDAWRLDADVVHALSHQGYDGLHGKIGLSNIQRFFNERLMLTANVQTSFADSNYMRAYYGVTTEQSMSSGLKPYAAENGFYKVGANLVAGYGITRHIAINGSVGYERLLDKAADSPIVQMANQYRAGVGVSYRF